MAYWAGMRAEMALGRSAVDLLHGADKDALADGQQVELGKETTRSSPRSIADAEGSGEGEASQAPRAGAGSTTRPDRISFARSGSGRAAQPDARIWRGETPQKAAGKIY